MIDLYFWTTDNGYKARQMIEEVGLAYAVKPVNLRQGAQFDPEFMKISPGHKIPAIVDPQGPGGRRVTLCESGAILTYLARKAGGALYPEDPALRPALDQWLFFGAATFTPLAQQFGLFFHRFGQDVPPAKAHYDAVLRDLFAIFDRHLAENEYFAGAYSIADIASYPDVHIHGADGIGLQDYPHLQRWHDAIQARDAVQRAWGEF